jgi:hypothetical protein
MRYTRRLDRSIVFDRVGDGKSPVPPIVQRHLDLAVAVQQTDGVWPSNRLCGVPPGLRSGFQITVIEILNRCKPFSVELTIAVSKSIALGVPPWRLLRDQSEDISDVRFSKTHTPRCRPNGSLHQARRLSCPSLPASSRACTVGYGPY